MLLLVHWPPLSFACRWLVECNIFYILDSLSILLTVYVTQTLPLAGTQFEISVKETHCDTLWRLKLRDGCFSISLNHLDSLITSFTTLQKKSDMDRNQCIGLLPSYKRHKCYVWTGAYIFVLLKSTLYCTLFILHYYCRAAPTQLN